VRLVSKKAGIVAEPLIDWDLAWGDPMLRNKTGKQEKRVTVFIGNYLLI
jgi:hypothetical protein